jgi:hypothetical protein
MAILLKLALLNGLRYNYSRTSLPGSCTCFGSASRLVLGLARWMTDYLFSSCPPAPLLVLVSVCLLFSMAPLAVCLLYHSPDQTPSRRTVWSILPSRPTIFVPVVAFSGTT